MAAGLRARWAATGLGMIPAQSGMAVLGRLLGDNAVDVAVLPVDWAKFLQQFPRGRHPAMLGDWVRQTQAAQPRQQSEAELALLRQHQDGRAGPSAWP